jgi:hypothetical protein
MLGIPGHKAHQDYQLANLQEGAHLEADPGAWPFLLRQFGRSFSIYLAPAKTACPYNLINSYS